MKNGNADRILQYIQDQQSELIELLKHMVDAESPSSTPESHRLMISVLTDAFTSLGIQGSQAPQSNSAHTHFFARREERNRALPAQLLVGHYDTVWPLGTIAKRPFTVDGNIVRGPGVFDMKGGLTQIVFALKALQELDLPMPLEPVIFINSDEEIGSRTSTKYVRALAKSVQRAFVLEPSMGEEGAIKTERKGIGRFTITVHGKAAHAGLDPEGGASAILELSHVIQTLFGLNDFDKGISGQCRHGRRRTATQCHRATQPGGRRRPRANHRRRRAHRGGYSRHAADDTGRSPARSKAVSAGHRWSRRLATRRCGNRPKGLEGTWASDLQQGAPVAVQMAIPPASTRRHWMASVPVGHGAHAEHEFLYIDKTLERTALLALLLLAPPTEREARHDSDAA